jgi:hypothetical protein
MPSIKLTMLPYYIDEKTEKVYCLVSNNINTDIFEVITTISKLEKEN